MASKLFIDTNIIIDILCKRADYDASATILNMGLKHEVELYITSLTLVNTMYIVRKELGQQKTHMFLKKICQFIHIAPCGQQETIDAFDLDSTDYEDALQYASAVNVEADCIITRNAKHFLFSKYEERLAYAPTSIHCNEFRLF